MGNKLNEGQYFGGMKNCSNIVHQVKMRCLFIDNDQGFSRQINKAFPIARKDSIHFVVSLKVYESVYLGRMLL